MKGTSRSLRSLSYVQCSSSAGAVGGMFAILRKVRPVENIGFSEERKSITAHRLGERGARSSPSTTESRGGLVRHR
jgi:hypothetical protein